jgi:nitroimidazol reductase NimA-like FMN-containing flavoprotein (pyridoxamine 5'-phosphate oxidase superfamily)
MKKKMELQEKIDALLSSQGLAVLSTGRAGRPYANLVAYAFSDDLRALYFATARSTRKYENLTQTDSAAMLIDNRSNREEDFHAAAAVTAMGRAIEVPPEERGAITALYLSRHPYLKTFVEAPTCALLALSVERYIYVERFQDVTELRF